MTESLLNQCRLPPELNGNSIEAALSIRGTSFYASAVIKNNTNMDNLFLIGHGKNVECESSQVFLSEGPSGSSQIVSGHNIDSGDCTGPHGSRITGNFLYNQNSSNGGPIDSPFGITYSNDSNPQVGLSA